MLDLFALKIQRNHIFFLNLANLVLNYDPLLRQIAKLLIIFTLKSSKA